jgi:hypothetical protein
MSKAVKLARAVGTGGVLEDGEIQAAQVSGLATVASTNSYTDLINKPTIPSVAGLASETYVNTQINNLIDGAPGTLNTLKEIADQLSTDQSAVGALTAVVNSKASTASLAAVATSGSYTDLINKPAGGTTYLKKTANYTAADRDGIIADTSGGVFTVFLPATPTLGMQVAIVDGHNWGANSLTVGRNGSTIEGLAEDLTLDIAGVSVQLIYDGATWEVFAQAGVLGANTITASNITGLATVATSGSYTDLTNKPTVISLKVSSIDYPGDDLAANPAGGQAITLTGTGFEATPVVYIGGVIAPSVTFVSSTELLVTTPARTAGTYDIYVVNPGGATAIMVFGISYSGTPAWTTPAGSLGTFDGAFSVQLQASGDAPITYSLTSGSVLPSGVTLSSGGLLTGSGIALDQTFNFSVTAIDGQNQDTPRSFLISITVGDAFFRNVSLLLSGNGTNGRQNNTFLNSSTLTSSAPVAIINAKVYSTFGSGTRSANYAVEYSNDGITWTTAFSGVMQSNSCGLITGTGGGGSYGSYMYWRYVVNSSVVQHHPRVSRIVLSTATTDYNIVVFVADNCSDSGEIPNQNAIFFNSTLITRNGNTTQGLFSPYGTLWSNNFIGPTSTSGNFGTGNYLTTATNAAFELGSGNWTFETWYCPTAKLNSFPRIFQIGNGSSPWGNGNSWALMDRHNDAPTKFSWACVNLGVNALLLTSNTTVQNGVWYHLAVVRNANTFTLYVNGIAEATYTNSGSVSVSSSCAAVIGSSGAGDSDLNGIVSNLRLVKGTALYTANFTPSTSPLTAVSGTSLLTCADNRFMDDSSNNFALSTVINNGNISVQRFSPFAPPAAYSPATTSGSAYFDGSGDYLTVAASSAFNFGTGDYTIEGWVNSSSTTWTLYGTGGGGSIDQFVCDGGILYWGYQDGPPSNFGIVNFFTLSDLNQWVHVAVSRSGTTQRCFKNGVVMGTITTSTSYGSSTASPEIGRRRDGSYLTTGYISNLRVVKGTGVYTSAFTPPTAPLTAIPGTSLLTSFTGAAIVDSAAQNNLETVGNAQISTSVVKYGTGSLSFDGNGDYLTSASSPNFAFGTGDFTVEAWIYANALNGERGFIQTSATVGGLQTSYTDGIAIFANGPGNGLVAQVGGVSLSSGNVITTNAWYHVALTRNSGSCRMFINGVLVAGPTTNASNLAGTNVCIGGYYNTSFLWNGYIDDLRITKGVARYTANFTPPTEQLKDR